MIPTALPKTRLTPTLIAPETFLVHDHQGEGSAPVCVALNSMVIRGREPVIVDTGEAANRERWFEDVFSLVEPEDVRWLFISHDDADHTGNLHELMDRCPNATLVINWFMVERMGGGLSTIPPSRWRWVSDGESLDVGDRVLQAVRPPVFDAPTTRGLYDPVTGVYWGSDTFATPMLAPVPVVDEFDQDFWFEGIATFGQYVSPWLLLADERRWQATVDRVAALDPTVVVGCHTPAVMGRDRVAQAIEATRRTPSTVVAAQPDQAVLDEINRVLGAAA
ncbi:MBL fold metallo-hydrolase [Sporichthya polymorpha]|uniref:MBL fold metallo-hydrolase n=1 Tax=Sporichthya polymorpha TaxID=35751 RepID=UPI0003637D41|nr:MBL fold metallo-hydrolase [Sporichthya polymorpha]